MIMALPSAGAGERRCKGWYACTELYAKCYALCVDVDWNRVSDLKDV